MKLIVCSKDIDATLIKGDLISWHNDSDFEGKEVGLFNAATNGKDPDEYLASTPFSILNLPLVVESDIQPILNEKIYLDPMQVPIADIETFSETSQDYTSKRKWKVDFSALEQRGQGSTYANDDVSPTKSRWEQVVSPPIRRDTLTAYNEITRADIVISDILVLR